MLGIETLGGNGAIESFSILPRLIRDNIVCENWEGTHNTLIAQTVRDLSSPELAAGFFGHLAELFGRVATTLPGTALLTVLDEAHRASVAGVRELASIADPGLAAYALKPHAERLADLFFALAWADDIATEPSPERKSVELDALSVFVDLRLRGTRRQPAPEVLARVAALTD